MPDGAFPDGEAPDRQVFGNGGGFPSGDIDTGEFEPGDIPGDLPGGGKYSLYTEWRIGPDGLILFLRKRVRENTKTNE